MIGRIEGTLIENTAPELLIDVAGVAYEIQAPLSTVFKLPVVGQTTILFTHLSIREDAHVLFGFATKGERSLFRALIKTSGVGPRMALSILSGMEPERFIDCIHEKDPAMLVKIPGVGKKTAERLIVEMQDRLKNLEGIDGLLEAPQSGSLTTMPRHAETDAEIALISLGYKPQQASRAIQLVNESGMTSEALIKAALKQM